MVARGGAALRHRLELVVTAADQGFALDPVRPTAVGGMAERRCPMMCPTCGADPCVNPGFCRTCRAADRRRGKRTDPGPIRVVANGGVPSVGELQRDYERAVQRRREQFGAPKWTVEAVMFSLREYGAAALAGPHFQRRLAELSPDQVRECIVRLDRLRPKYPAITDNLMLLLGELIT
jgi:hypothetical protein